MAPSLRSFYSLVQATLLLKLSFSRLERLWGCSLGETSQDITSIWCEALNISDNSPWFTSISKSSLVIASTGISEMPLGTSECLLFILVLSRAWKELFYVKTKTLPAGFYDMGKGCCEPCWDGSCERIMQMNCVRNCEHRQWGLFYACFY